MSFFHEQYSVHLVNTKNNTNINRLGDANANIPGKERNNILLSRCSDLEDLEIERRIDIFLIKSSCNQPSKPSFLFKLYLENSCKQVFSYLRGEEWRSINCDRRLTVSVTLTELGNKLCFESVKFWRLFIICKYLESLQSAGIQTDANGPKYI